MPNQVCALLNTSLGCPVHGEEGKGARTPPPEYVLPQHTALQGYLSEAGASIVDRKLKLHVVPLTSVCRRPRWSVASSVHPEVARTFVVGAGAKHNVYL